MKIMFAADFHVGWSQYGLEWRYQDFFRSVGRLVELVEHERPDLLLIGGDVFHKKQLDPRTLAYMIDFFKDMSKISKIFVVHGNHDSPSYKQSWSWLEVLELLGYIKLLKNESVDFHGVKIYGFPYTTSKRLFEGLKAEEGDILLAHFAVEGVMPVPAVPKDFVKSLQFSKILVGHIHKHYKLLNVYSPGSLESTSFNEEGFHGGVWIFEDDEERFVEIPRREIKTIKLNASENPPLREFNEDTLVRVLIHGDLEVDFDWRQFVKAQRVIVEDRRVKETKVFEEQTEEELIREFFGEDAECIFSLLEVVRSSGGRVDEVITEYARRIA
ncbi:MAG: metallophosphoesterase family protein [Candidatus Thorarchaeota archaeon]